MADPVPLVLDPAIAEPPPTDRGTLYFIGNATVLIRLGGFTILTDPSFIHKHDQTWLGYGLHTERLTDPACELADLPPLDLVLLSHFHGDHFDQAAEEGLDRSLPIVTTPQSAKLLAERGFPNTWPLDRWQTQTVAKGVAELRITAMPGHHGPPLVDAALPDVMGSLLEFGRVGQAPRFRIYITGDTLLIDDLREIPRRYPEIDLALLHLGGTRVLGILVSMDADQGVTCLQLVNPRRAVPIHFDDYDVFKSPLADFQEAVAAAGWADRVSYLDRGDTLAIGPGVAAAVRPGLGPTGDGYAAPGGEGDVQAANP
jgi:L-ascorbate metabolism protein UlaG (beta-lactamase superfamily)